MLEKVKKISKQWLNEEEGFQVFEKFGLTQGGVLLALGVAAVAMFVMNDFWGGVGSRYFGSDGGLDALQPSSAPGQVGWDEPNTGWN